jgi:hypothetical protein
VDRNAIPLLVAEIIVGFLSGVLAYDLLVFDKELHVGRSLKIRK